VRPEQFRQVFCQGSASWARAQAAVPESVSIETFVSLRRAGFSPRFKPFIQTGLKPRAD